MRVTHRVDYAVRACTALARMLAAEPAVPVSKERLATAESIPPTFLDAILRQLRNSGVLKSHRGPEGGWTFARPPAEISVADLIRVLEGPLASVRGVRPDELAAQGEPEPFVSLWIAVRVSLRSVLEAVTVADLAAGRLPAQVRRLTTRPGAWDQAVRR